MSKKSKKQDTSIAKLDTSVLSFEKKLVPSDGFMYETKWNDNVESMENGSRKLFLKEKTVRGTISNRTEETKLDKHNVDAPNIQTVDYCDMSENYDTLKLHFTLKVLGGLKNPSTCNNNDFKKKYQEKLKDIDGEVFDELAKRYVISIANGRFLWRNRVGAEKIKVVIKLLASNLEDTDKSNQSKWEFNAFDFDLNNLDKNSEKVLEISNMVSKVLKSEDEFLIFDITAYCKVGETQEVYPSQEFVQDQGKKSTGEKSKVLYHNNGVAALHSQKIGNAIRTIDIWYEGANKPISIESYGSVTNEGTSYRLENGKNFYSLFDKWITKNEDPSDQKEYVIAMLIRGGVFGKKRKKDSGENNKNSEIQQESE